MNKARELVEILAEAKQEIPPKLAEMGMSGGGRKGGGRGGGRGGYGGRGGFGGGRTGANAMSAPNMRRF